MRLAIGGPSAQRWVSSWSGRAEQAEPDERVRRAIAELPERQRLVLFLRYFADLDYAGIERVMRVRPGTVAAALNAARAAVKESLEREEAACQS